MSRHMSKREKRERQSTKDRNLHLLRVHGIQFTQHATTVSIRRPVKIEFYPSTGRWVYLGRTYSGVLDMVALIERVEASRGHMESALCDYNPIADVWPGGDQPRPLDSGDLKPEKNSGFFRRIFSKIAWFFKNL